MCCRLQTIYVEDGCDARFSGLEIPESVKIVPVLAKARNPKQLKDSEIPDGTRLIRARQFIDKKITNITVPASVREIQTEAFYNCQTLKIIVFAKGSQLEKIGCGAF